MSEKIKVEVFGLKDQAVGGGCGDGCGSGCCGPDACGPQLTMGEMFEGLEEYFNASDIKDKVELKFIDIMDDMNEYPHVVTAIEKGISIPITAVDGKLRFHRGISNEMIFEAVEETLKG